MGRELEQTVGSQQAAPSEDKGTAGFGYIGNRVRCPSFRNKLLGHELIDARFHRNSDVCLGGFARDGQSYGHRWPWRHTLRDLNIDL